MGERVTFGLTATGRCWHLLWPSGRALTRCNGQKIVATEGRPLSEWATKAHVCRRCLAAATGGDDE